LKPFSGKTAEKHASARELAREKGDMIIEKTPLPLAKRLRGTGRGVLFVSGEAQFNHRLPVL
jgi:hypothetical protein